jgi:hypothetical protein
MSALPLDLAAELLKFVEPTRSEPPGVSGSKRGRPKALNNQRLGRLLKAVAQIHSKNKALRSASRIAAALKKRTEYAACSERTLRRYVKNAIDYEIGLLKAIPADHWKEFLGISPPQGAITKKVLGEKAFELLRYQLRQHELLAKKR